MRDYGFVFKEHKEILENIQKNLIGWTPCGKTNILKDVQIIGTFSEKDDISKTNEIGVEKYNSLKQQEIDIDKIYLTKRHSEFIKLIGEFRDDPFMPSAIQQTLIELSNDINNNLTIILKGELEIFMLNFSKVYFEKSKAPNFDPIGVYNNFNHSRVHHRQTLDKLRNEIRKYLRIDEGW